MSLIAYDKNDALRDMSVRLKEGGRPGLVSPFKCLHEFYSHKAGGVTDWTGFPASGKSYFVLEYLMALSEKHGLRHGLFVPDIGSKEEIVEKLIKMRTGKDFTDRYYNKIDPKEMIEAMNWVMHFFVIFKRADFKRGVTPINFWEMIVNYNDSSTGAPEGRLNTGLADSWKNFSHLYNGREDSYLDEILSIRNEMAEDHQVHLHTIAHAIKTEILDPKMNARRIPTAWDIKGGGSWYSNGKTIVTGHRKDKTTNGFDLYFSKVKPEDVGSEGEIVNKLFLDKKRGRYFELLDGVPQYAYGWENHIAPEPIEYVNSLALNLNLDPKTIQVPF